MRNCDYYKTPRGLHQAYMDICDAHAAGDAEPPCKGCPLETTEKDGHDCFSKFVYNKYQPPKRKKA